MASCVNSIDIVWDLLGSSLSILLSYLIPCACFIKIMGDATQNLADDGGRDLESGRRPVSKSVILIAKSMIVVYVILMIISTVNAFIDTIKKNS